MLTPGSDSPGTSSSVTGTASWLQAYRARIMCTSDSSFDLYTAAGKPLLHAALALAYPRVH
jgi:hypothetical protein